MPGRQSFLRSVEPVPKTKSQYDSTLHLPKTLFEMRAGLPKKEPAMLEDWDKNGLYEQIGRAHV